MRQHSMPTVKHIGKSYVTYSLSRKHGTYSLAVCTDQPAAYSVKVDDIARDFATAEKIRDLFADNLVFPANVLEIFDDILGI